eukprot:g3372.t1
MATNSIDLELEQARLFESLASRQEPTDGYDTTSSDQQADCEEECFRLLARQFALDPPFREKLVERGLLNSSGEVLLLRDRHIEYLYNGLNEKLNQGFACLDASRPWLVYWMVHGLSLLGARPEPLFPRIVDFLQRCQNQLTGGFAGGPQQLAHLAPTYAAVLALASISTEEALSVPNRGKMYRWMMSLKHATGGVHIHEGGEVDIRSTYLCLAVAKILNILTPELADGMEKYVLDCQTYEGGFGGEPMNEAHGGYAFNALAALHLLGKMDLCDHEGALRWLCARQMRFEGGFQGRVNKLVDGCYSFWCGAEPALLAMSMKKPNKSSSSEPVLMPYDTSALQRYILYCCQQEDGGLRDKPSKRRDYYHSCYCLSGLSVAQHFGTSVVGPAATNLLEPTDPCVNVCSKMLAKTMKYYSTKPNSHEELMKLDK